MLGILGFLGVQPQPAADDAVGSSRAVIPIDPYLYASFDEQVAPRDQKCVGLLGLCLGQPVDLAVQAFGRIEAAGAPYMDVLDRGWLCHAWEPPRFARVEVCENHGSIAAVSLRVPAESRAVVALPEAIRADLPQDLATLAREVSRGLDINPSEWASWTARVTGSSPSSGSFSGARGYPLLLWMSQAKSLGLTATAMSSRLAVTTLRTCSTSLKRV